MINNVYLSNVEKIKKVLESEGSVTLHNFLDKNFFESIRTEIRSLKFKKEANLITHSYSKSYFSARKNFISNFNDYIQQFGCNKVTNIISLKFTWKDYIILNDNVKTKQGYEIILNLIDWKQERGGSLYYLDAHGNYIQINDTKNSLTIIRVDKNTKSFVKYCNNKSKNKFKYLLKFVS